MARILDSDGIAASAVEKIRALGHTVDVLTDHPKDKIVDIIADYDCLIVRSATKVREPMIDAMKNMKLVIRGGVGIDNIDHKYAESKGIHVRNTPAASSDSVAELALAHMFSVYRFLPQANVTMRKGEWNKKKYEGRELAGKTLGIIGIGRIGNSLAKKALALGMKVISFDPFVKTCDGDITLCDKDELLAKSDFVSLHIPFSGEPCIGKAEIAKMKDGAVLINCARGGVVDEDALCDALDSGKLSGAGIDVYAKEPTPNERLYTHPMVSMTPHIGATTGEAQDRIGDEIVKIIAEYFG